MYSGLAHQHDPDGECTPDSDRVLTSASFPWPSSDPVHGRIRLRRFVDQDAEMAVELSQDDYIPRIGSLPHRCSPAEGLAWVNRQLGRHANGTGFSFAIVDEEAGLPVGNIGLWTKDLAEGRAQAGYGVVPSARGRRVAAGALTALLKFAWTIPHLHRVELHIEPWNVASTRSAELAAFEREGVLRSHQEISGRRVDMLVFSAVRESSTPRAQPLGEPGSPGTSHD